MSRSLGVPDVSGAEPSGDPCAPLATADVEVAPESPADEAEGSGAAFAVEGEPGGVDGVAGDEPAHAASAARATGATTNSEVKADREEEAMVIDAPQLQ